MIRDPARFLRLLMLVSGVLSLIVASAFLLEGTWEGAPRSFAQQPSEPTPTPRTDEFSGLPARPDHGHLFEGLVDLAGEPTPTPTPSPPPTATAEPPAVPPTSIPEHSQPHPTVPVATPVPPPASEPGCPTAAMSGYGLDLFNAINGERAAAGLPTLAVNGCVVYVAQLRSNDMASRGYFSHTSPDGQTAFGLLDYYGIPYGWAGENLARNNYPADQAVAVAIRDLMASQGHRDNILSPNYTEMGVAVATDGAGMHYFTMLFIGPA